MQGRVKFHRKITEREWYSDANTFRVFFHLILTANHKDGKRQGIDVKRGQTITSVDHIAESLNLSVQQIRTALNKLILTGEISKKATNKFTLVTVLKYCDYNDLDLEDNKQITNEQQTNNKQITTNKNDKKAKKEKSIFVAPSLQEVIDYFSANGYTTETAERAYKGYDVADRHDSTGKKVINWKQKMVQVRFKPENTKKYTKTEYLQIESERERDKAGATAKYGDAVIKKAIAVYNENN